MHQWRRKVFRNGSGAMHEPPIDPAILFTVPEFGDRHPAVQGISLKTVATLILITLFGAAAAITLGGAFGYWNIGMAFAGAFLLSATVVFILLLRRDRQDMAADSDLVQAILQGARRPSAITDKSGVLRTSNSGWRVLFNGRAQGPKALKGEGLDVEALIIQAQKEGFASVSIDHSNIGPFHLELSHHRRFLIWQLDPEAGPRLLEKYLGGIELERLDQLGGLGLGIVVADDSGVVRHYNHCLAEWCGLDADGGFEPTVDQLLSEDLRCLRPVGNEDHIAVKTIAFPLAPASQPDALDEAVGRLFVIVREDQTSEMSAGAEAALLNAPLRAAPIAVATVDDALSLVDANRRFYSLLGGERPENGTDILSLVHSEDRPELKRALQTAFAGSAQTRPLEVRIGEEAAHTCQVYLNLVDQADPAVAVLYLIDTTERKSLEQQFVQAQKMQAVGQLAGGVAHDFNNLLTAIIGYCDLLLVRHTAGDESFTDIMQIKQNANRAANLVRQLLAFSRQQTLRPKVLMITDVLAELSNLLRRLIGERIELKMVHGRDLGPIKVDEGQLEQVIINLAVNARDAMSDGGTLTISTRQVAPDDPAFKRHKMMPAGDYVLVEVSDTGVGIAKEHLDKVFDPFFTTKEVGKGTGLGLSTVYGIVKQTGGFIFADSVPGEGATFRLYLPVHKDAQQEAKKKDEPAMRDLTGKGTVLIVEDEDPVRTFASRALSNKGYTVLEAESGEEGLAVVSSHDGRIDLLITDVVMPNMDGPALVEEVRRFHSELKIIFISGYTEDVFRETVGNEEFAFLPKPFTLKQLAQKVKEVVG